MWCSGEALAGGRHEVDSLEEAPAFELLVRRSRASRTVTMP